MSSLHYLQKAAESRRKSLCTSGGDYIPITLHQRQQELYDDDRLDVFYGGAVGGGKSFAMLATALKFAHVPGYDALLIRRSYTHLHMPGAFIPVSREWLRGHAVYRNSEHRWEFPSGATLTFGYLDNVRDLDRYQGGAWSFIGVDEVTQLIWEHVRYLNSRLRKAVDIDVPLRFRTAGNPGGPSHEQVKQHYLTEQHPDRRFIPSRLDDNPSLDREKYMKSLDRLHPLTRQRLVEGDWDAMPEGGFFRREWWTLVDPEEVPHDLRWLRYWDPASTEPKEGKDPDWTSGALMALRRGVFWVGDIRRTRGTPEHVESFIRATALEDGKKTAIILEKEPGSSGEAMVSYYARHVLRGYDFQGVRSTGSKVERAAPLAAAAQNGNVRIARCKALSAFLDEADAFYFGPHDDMVDSMSGAFAALNERAGTVRSIRVRGL